MLEAFASGLVEPGPLTLWVLSLGDVSRRQNQRRGDRSRLSGRRGAGGEGPRLRLRGTELGQVLEVTLWTNFRDAVAVLIDAERMSEHREHATIRRNDVGDPSRDPDEREEDAEASARSTFDAIADERERRPASLWRTCTACRSLSVLTPTIDAPASAISAKLSRKSPVSTVQPGVNAFGKK